MTTASSVCFSEKRKLSIGILRSCFLSSFIQFRSVVPENKSKMSEPIRDHGCHAGFLICPKITNMVEGVELLILLKFCQIQFSSFRSKLEKVNS